MVTRALACRRSLSLGGRRGRTGGTRREEERVPMGLKVAGILDVAGQ